MCASADQEALGWPETEGSSIARTAPVSIEVLVRALQPLSILQIGVTERLWAGPNPGVALAKARSLGEALEFLDQEEFDAVVLGSGLADAWSPRAYECVAEVARSTPIVVLASVEVLTAAKRQLERDHDVIVAAAAPSSTLERLTLAAILRARILAENPGLQIG